METFTKERSGYKILAIISSLWSFVCQLSNFYLVVRWLMTVLHLSQAVTPHEHLEQLQIFYMFSPGLLWSIWCQALHSCLFALHIQTISVSRVPWLHTLHYSFHLSRWYLICTLTYFCHMLSVHLPASSSLPTSVPHIGVEYLYAPSGFSSIFLHAAAILPLTAVFTPPPSLS